MRAGTGFVVVSPGILGAVLALGSVLVPGAGRDALAQDASRPRDLVEYTRGAIEREHGRLATETSRIFRAVHRKEISESEAVSQLVAMGPAIVPVLWRRLEDPDDSPQAARAGRAAARAIVALGTEEDRARMLGLAREPGAARLKTIPALAGVPGADARSVLEELAGHDDAAVRLLVCGALGGRDEPEAVDLLVTLLADGDALVRSEAALLLRGRVRPRDAGAILAALEREGDRSVRMVLYESLGSLRGDAVLDALENGALRDRDSSKAMLAVVASLEAIGGDRAASILHEMALRRGGDATAARKALVRLGDVDALEPLLAPYARAIQRDSKDPALYRGRADLLREVRLWDRAADDYERALALLPRQDAEASNVTVDLARCYVREGKLKRAHDLLRRRGPADLTRYRDDEDFAALRDHPTYGKVFETP